MGLAHRLFLFNSPPAIPYAVSLYSTSRHARLTDTTRLLKFRSLHIWLYVGLLGFLFFILMRPVIDYDAGIPNQLDPISVKQKALNFSGLIGLPLDSTLVRVSMDQNVNFYERLKVANEIDDNNSIYKLHYLKYPLSGWSAVMSHLSDSASIGEVNSEQARRILLRYDRSGRMTSVRMYQPQRYSIKFIQTDMVSAFDSLITVMGYNPHAYTLQPNDPDDFMPPSGANPPGREHVLLANERLVGEPDKIVIRTILMPARFVAIPGASNLIPEGIREFQIGQRDSSIAPIRPMAYAIESAVTHYDGVAVANLTRNFWNDHAVFVYAISIIVVVIILIATVRRVYRNQVDWHRGSWVFFVFGGGILLWAVVHLLGYSVGNVPSDLFWLYMISSTVNGLLSGFFIAVSYFTWESVARPQHHSQIIHVDTLWRGRLFVRETGEAVLYGYAFAGALLGYLFLLFYAADALLLQNVGMGGIHEATSLSLAIAVPLNGVLTAAVLGFGPLGVIYSWIRGKSGDGWLSFSLTAVISGFAMAAFARFIQTDQSVFVELAIFILFSFALVYVLSRFGMISLMVALTLVVTMCYALPFIGSGSIFYGTNIWIVWVLITLPLIYGFVTMKFGQPLAREQRYVPEYLEVTIKQERFEREIEIARESQFALMPVNAPVLQGHDVKGFFIPSLEVGGDYYDYHVRYDAAGNPQSLFLALVDVSGKAMKAAMQAVFTSGLILSRLDSDAPDTILRAINPILKEKTDSKTFITCLIGELQLDSNMLRLSNAGHCQPILKRNGKAEFLESPHPRFPLGFRQNVNYALVDVPLQSGDVLIMYSDGLPEAKNQQNEEYGFDRTLRYIEELPTDRMSSTEVCLDIKKMIQQFSNYSMRDDTTVVCLKVR